MLVFDERLLVLHVLRLADGLQRFTSERLSVLVNCENILKTLCVPLLIQNTVPVR